VEKGDGAGEKGRPKKKERPGARGFGTVVGPEKKVSIEKGLRGGEGKSVKRKGKKHPRAGKLREGLEGRRKMFREKEKNTHHQGVERPLA